MNVLYAKRYIYTSDENAEVIMFVGGNLENVILTTHAQM